MLKERLVWESAVVVYDRMFLLSELGSFITCNVAEKTAQLELSIEIKMRIHL